MESRQVKKKGAARFAPAGADTLTMGELAIREDRRKRQAKWWAGLTPEELKRQKEKKRERIRLRETKKGPTPAKARGR